MVPVARLRPRPLPVSLRPSAAVRPRRRPTRLRPLRHRRQRTRRDGAVHAGDVRLNWRRRLESNQLPCSPATVFGTARPPWTSPPHAHDARRGDPVKRLREFTNWRDALGRAYYELSANRRERSSDDDEERWIMSVGFSGPGQLAGQPGISQRRILMRSRTPEGASIRRNEVGAPGGTRTRVARLKAECTGRCTTSATPRLRCAGRALAAPSARAGACPAAPAPP